MAARLDFPIGEVIRGSDPSGQLYWENILSRLSLPPRIRALLRTLTPQLMADYLTKQGQLGDWEQMWTPYPGQTKAIDYTFEDYITGKNVGDRGSLLKGMQVPQLVRQALTQFPQVMGQATPSSPRTRAY